MKPSHRWIQLWWPALVCGAAGLGVFQFFGNTSFGYIKSSSLFHWWTYQWSDPASETEHGWLILALSVWLFWRNLRDRRRRAEDGGRMTDDGGQRTEGGGRRTDDGGRRTEDGDLDDRISEGSPNNGYGAAAAAMAGGLALHALGFAAQQTRVSIIAFLLFTWGVLRFGGGRRWGAAAMFPLAFMLFAIPVNVLDSLGLWLRMGVVDASAAFARAAGIAVLKSGTQLVAPDGRYHYDVAAVCSGVRSLTAMVALSLLAGYLEFRGWRRRSLLLLLSFPLVYVGNVARILAIILAAQLGGPRWGDGAHKIMGFGVFVIVLGGVLAAIALLRRYFPEREPEALRRPGIHAESAPGPVESPRRAGAASGVGARRWLRTSGATFVAGAVVVLALGEMAFLHHLESVPARGRVGVRLAADGVNPVALPAFLGVEWVGRRTEVTSVERDILPPDTGFSRKLYVPIADPRRTVLLSIVLSGRDRTSIHRPELCLLGQGWTVGGATGHRFRQRGLGGGSFPVTVLRVAREVPTARGAVRVPQLTVYWFIGGDEVVATHWQRIARDAWNRVVHARADRWAYVLMQTDASDGEAAALARMQAVIDQTLPVFQRETGAK